MDMRTATKSGSQAGPVFTVAAQGWPDLWRRDNLGCSISWQDGSRNNGHIPQGPDAYRSEPAVRWPFWRTGRYGCFGFPAWRLGWSLAGLRQAPHLAFSVVRLTSPRQRYSLGMIQFLTSATGRMNCSTWNILTVMEVTRLATITGLKVPRGTTLRVSAWVNPEQIGGQLPCYITHTTRQRLRSSAPICTSPRYIQGSSRALGHGIAHQSKIRSSGSRTRNSTRYSSNRRDQHG